MQREWYALKVGPKVSRRVARKRFRRRPFFGGPFWVERLEERCVLSADPFALGSNLELVSAVAHDCAETGLPVASPVLPRLTDPRPQDFSLQWFAGDSPASGAAIEWPLLDNEETFTLHSNPDSTKKIYLDFDGHTTTGTMWNSTSMLPNIFSPAFDVDGDARFNDFEHQVFQLIWALVAEDFLPFDIDVTTEDPGEEALKKSNAGDQEYGVRVVLSGLSTDWYVMDPAMAVGGVAQLNSFSFNTDTPVFVFPFEPGLNSVKSTAEATSHEVGHSFGLTHDGDAQPFVPPNVYYPGHGGGPTGWAPIMGVSYGQNLTQWSKGEYPWANNTMQDDLAVITGAQHGVTFRTDDHGNDQATATAMSATGTEIFAEGIIEQSTDLDWFVFDLGVEEIIFEIDPHPWQPNLDIEAKIYDADGELVETSNPLDGLNATFTLNTMESDLYVPGRYFLSIDGIGKPATTDPGYTDYGSLGYYSISAARKSLLDVLIGVEFDIPLAEGGTRPDDWAFYGGGGTIAVLSDIKDEAGKATPINLTIESSGSPITSQANELLPNTVPLHPQSLEALDGFITVPSGESLTFTWSDLEPFTIYEVYVFGVSDVDVANGVQIVGDGMPIIYDQTVTGDELEINDQTGDNTRQLVSYTRLVTSDENGRITIMVNSSGELPESTVAVGGLAIRPGTFGSVGGQKWNDKNGNGVKDGPDDPEDPMFENGLPGWTIFIDENGNGQLDESFVETLHSGDVPQDIKFSEDPTQRTVKSELFVEGIRSIHDIDITLDITHTFAADLNAYLISPSGTRVKLFSDVGVFHDNFENIKFDDEAVTAISTAQAPFSGTYRPEEAVEALELATYPGLQSVLSAFDGEDANGLWILEIKDDAPEDDGVLNSWSLTISGREESTITDGNGNYAFDNLAPGVYDLQEVIPTGEQSAGTTIESTDVPVDILDLTTITSEVDVSGVGEIIDLDVKLDISHTWDADLNVFLISPLGTRVELFSGIAPAGLNFTNTVLDDEAVDSIVNGAPPFTGTFRPMGSLSDFDGEDSDGTWILEITDTFFFDEGSLNSWSLTIRGTAPAVNWTQTFAPPPVTLTSGGRVRGIDFGNWVPDIEIVPAKISGQKFHDVNADGIKDEGEPGLPDWTIYVDGNNNGILDEEATVTVDSTDVPAPIEDFETLTSELEFVGLSSIVDIDITLDIVHTFAADLDVYLISPSGTQVELFTGVGGEFNDFHDTTLDDAAEVLIVDASAPFNGRFRAEGLLGDFNGEDPNGLWQLLIRDTTEADEGALISWSLTIVGSERSAVTDEEGNYEFGSLAAGDYVIREVQQPGWRQTIAPPAPITIEDFEQFDTADFGNTESLALAGDYNGDGAVDAVDVIIWRKTEGQNVTNFSGADGDGDGIIGQGDYDLWRMNYGMTVAPGGGSALAAAANVQAAPTTSTVAASSGAMPGVKVRIAAMSAGTSSKLAGVAAAADAPAFAHAGDAMSGRGSLSRQRPAARDRLATPQAPIDAALLEWATSRSFARRDRAQSREFWTNDHSEDSAVQDLGTLDSAFESFEAVAS
jgi:subtilisin-like proprotein convertase family protein